MGLLGTTTRVLAAVWTCIVSLGAFSTVSHGASGGGMWWDGIMLGLIVGLLGSILETWAGYYLGAGWRWVWWLLVAVVTFAMAGYVVPGLSTEGVVMVSITVSWMESIIPPPATIR